MHALVLSVLTGIFPDVQWPLLQWQYM